MSLLNLSFVGILVLALLFSPVPASPVGPLQTRGTLNVAVDLVLLDVSVSDEKGRPIQNLDRKPLFSITPWFRCSPALYAASAKGQTRTSRTTRSDNGPDLVCAQVKLFFSVLFLMAFQGSSEFLREIRESAGMGKPKVAQESLIKLVESRNQFLGFLRRRIPSPDAAEDLISRHSRVSPKGMVPCAFTAPATPCESRFVWPAGPVLNTTISTAGAGASDTDVG